MTLALAAACANASIARAEPRIFIGGVGPNFCTRMQSVADVSDMIALDSIGLYQHANGVAACTPEQLAPIRTLWLDARSPGAPERPSVAEIGGYTAADEGTQAFKQYLAYFGGAYPSQVNMNIITGSGDGSGIYAAAPHEAKPGTSYTGFVTQDDLAKMQSAVRLAEAHGAASVAIVLTPNGGGEDLDDAFATGGFWANARSTALYGRAIALDVPSNYFFARGAPYQAFVAQMIKWGISEKLRVSLIVSPYALKPDAAGNEGGCGFDPSFLEATIRLLAQLRAAGAMPTQWVVENYGERGPHCGTANDVQSHDAPESLNAVALYLARATASPVDNPR